MNPTGAVFLCYVIMSTFYSVGGSGESYTFCGGMRCPPNTFCSMATTVVNGKRETIRTCTDSDGNVVARSISGDDEGQGHGSRRSNVVQSSSIMMSGGGGSCVQQTSSVNGVTTTTYQCSTDDGNSYYVTNTDGVYKNCTSVPVSSHKGVTTMKEHCVDLSPKDIKRVKQMEKEMQKQAEAAKEQIVGIQNRMMQNMHNSFGEGMLKARQMQEQMLQTAEEAQQRAWEQARNAQAQSQASVQHALQNIENIRQSMQNMFGNQYW